MAGGNEANEILLLPFFGQGHLFPFIELSKHLSTLSFTTTLIIPSSVSSSLRRHHHLRVVEIPSSASPLDPPPGAGPGSGPYEQLAHGIESFLVAQPVRPICVVIDIMMGWAKTIFKKFDVPVVALFTSGACSSAMEYASWKAHVGDLKPDEARVLPGLPREMAVLYTDIKRQAHHGPPPRHQPDGPRGPRFSEPENVGFEDTTRPHPHDGPDGLGPGFPPVGPPGPRFPKPKDMGFNDPPGPGQPPPWLNEVDGTAGVMINTCHELEGPFIDYVANQVQKPVWAVGPLLPEEYWKSTGVLVHDHDIRAKKQSNFTEEEVVRWLDSKPHKSVLYISFGSEVGPTLDEYAELASALEANAINQPFIWVIQPNSGRPGPPPPLVRAQPILEGYFPHELEKNVGKRGLIISGWAPQLLILSHPSTGGFVSHCGWNSTLETIGRGVPLLAWPIRGDQFHNAKLVVSFLKVGYMVKGYEHSSNHEMVMKDDIIRGIEKIMSDEGVKQRASVLQAKFEGGIRQSSKAVFNAFRHFILCIERDA